MANVLSDEKRQQVVALGRLGWSLRRIQRESGVRRETASAYLKAAGIDVSGHGGAKPKPATSGEVITDLAAANPATRPEVITDLLTHGTVPVPRAAPATEQAPTSTRGGS